MDAIIATKKRYCFAALLTSLFLLLFLLPLPFVCLAVEAPIQQAPSFSSVEERRLNVAIEEERLKIIEEKKALSLREKELKSLESAVDKKLAEIDSKLTELQRQQEELAVLLLQKDVEEAKKREELSKIYEKMDPVKAALTLAELDQQLAADLLAGMKPRAAARVLDSLNRQKASEISRTFSTIPLE